MVPLGEAILYYFLYVPLSCSQLLIRVSWCLHWWLGFFSLLFDCVRDFGSTFFINPFYDVVDYFSPFSQGQPVRVFFFKRGFLVLSRNKCLECVASSLRINVQSCVTFQDELSRRMNLMISIQKSFFFKYMI